MCGGQARECARRPGPMHSALRSWHASTQHARPWHLWSHGLTFKDIRVRGQEPGGARAGHKRRVVGGGGAPRGIHSKVVIVHNEVAGRIKREEGDKGRHCQVLCHREVEVDSAVCTAGEASSVWTADSWGCAALPAAKLSRQAPCAVCSLVHSCLLKVSGGLGLCSCR